MKIVRKSEVKPPLTIEFQPDEIQGLVNILAHVGGNMTKSKREYVHRFSLLVAQEGYQLDLDDNISGSIYCGLYKD